MLPWSVQAAQLLWELAARSAFSWGMSTTVRGLVLVFLVVVAEAARALVFEAEVVARPGARWELVAAVLQMLFAVLLVCSLPLAAGAVAH